MAKAKVTIVRTKTRTKKKTGKKGNPNHCPTCGKFWNKKS